MEKVWLTSQEAKDYLGYKSADSINRLARNTNLRVKHFKGKHLYHKHDLEQVRSKTTKMDPHQHEPLTQFNTYLRIPETKVILVADAHCPLIDWNFWEDVKRIKDEMDINTLILGGDTLDCGAFSKFYDMFTIPWEIEKESAQKFLKEAVQEFDKVYLLTANHELRMLRLLNASYSPAIVEQDQGHKLDVWETVAKDIVANNADRLTISIYPYCDVGEYWRIAHPNVAWKNPLGFARHLSAVCRRSVVITHAHMSAWSPAPCWMVDGIPWTLIDCGIFASPASFSYKNLRITGHHLWSESFVIIDNEWGSLYMKGNPSPVVRRG